MSPQKLKQEHERDAVHVEKSPLGSAPLCAVFAVGVILQLRQSTAVATASRNDPWLLTCTPTLSQQSHSSLTLVWWSIMPAWGGELGRNGVPSPSLHTELSRNSHSSSRASCAESYRSCRLFLHFETRRGPHPTSRRYTRTTITKGSSAKVLIHRWVALQYPLLCFLCWSHLFGFKFISEFPCDPHPPDIKTQTEIVEIPDFTETALVKKDSSVAGYYFPRS